MKHDAKARACRLDLSLAELRSLVGLAQRGAREGAQVDADLVDGLQRAYASQEAKAEEIRGAAADRRASRTPSNNFDRTRQHFSELEEYQVTATRGDFIDTSPLPYHRTWSPLTDDNAGAQGELRRNVWCVHVHTRNMYRDFVGHSITATDDRDEIEAIARAVIAAHA